MLRCSILPLCRMSVRSSIAAAPMTPERRNMLYSTHEKPRTRAQAGCGTFVQGFWRISSKHSPRRHNSPTVMRKLVSAMRRQHSQAATAEATQLRSMLLSSH